MKRQSPSMLSGVSHKLHSRLDSVDSVTVNDDDDDTVDGILK